MSPKNSAITTTSRKLAEANSAKIAKFRPLDVARSTNADDADRLLLVLLGAALNAISSRNGSTARNPSANWVRRRRSWRRSSTPSRSVRDAR